MKQNEWIENFIIEIVLMKKNHETKDYKYVGDYTAALYSYEFPPEYKMSLLSGERIIVDASDDIYCFLVRQFRKMTGLNPPINFQISRIWQEILRKKTIGWSDSIVELFINVFKKGTSIEKKDRYKSVLELIDDDNMKQLLEYRI